MPNDAQGINAQTLSYIAEGIYSRENKEDDYVELNVINRDDKIIVTYKYTVIEDNSGDNDDPDIYDNIDYEKLITY